jgi:hypothetical protein
MQEFFHGNRGSLVSIGTSTPEICKLPTPSRVKKYFFRQGKEHQTRLIPLRPAIAGLGFAPNGASALFSPQNFDAPHLRLTQGDQVGVQPSVYA